MTTTTAPVRDSARTRLTAGVLAAPLFLIISALQLVFTTIVTLAAGRAAGANLSVFTPTLEDTTFVYKFLSYIDVFYVWSTLVTAIGLGVLYKRRTGPIAMVLFGIYFVIAALIAYVASGS